MRPAAGSHLIHAHTPYDDRARIAVNGSLTFGNLVLSSETRREIVSRSRKQIADMPEYAVALVGDTDHQQLHPLSILVSLQ
jgi:hypothetical protein